MTDIFWHRNGMAETITLDTTGLLCPLPVLKLRKRLQAVASGTEVELIADDPAAVIDVPHFCSETGNELVAQSDEAGVMSFRIRKG